MAGNFLRRTDGRWERMCEHGTGHTVSVPPQYVDDKAWWVHGCDGCCAGWTKGPPLSDIVEPVVTPAAIRFADIEQEWHTVRSEAAKRGWVTRRRNQAASQKLATWQVELLSDSLGGHFVDPPTNPPKRSWFRRLLRRKE